MIKRFENPTIEVDLPDLTIPGLGSLKRKGYVRDIPLTLKENSISAEVYVTHFDSLGNEVRSGVEPYIRTLRTSPYRMVHETTGEYLADKADYSSKDEIGSVLYGKNYMPQAEWYYQKMMSGDVNLVALVRKVVYDSFV